MKCTRSKNEARKSEGEKIIALLSERGASVNLSAIASTGDMNKLKKALSRSPVPGKQQLNAAVIAASAAGRVKVVTLLLERGAEATYATPRGLTGLAAAAAGGHVETMRILLDKGADPNATTNDGETALKAATRRGHREVVELLRSRGAPR